MNKLEVFFAYIQGHDEYIAYGLDSTTTLETAQDSFWASEYDGAISIVSEEIVAYEFITNLDHKEGETNHIVWQCPICKNWESEDYVPNNKPPILVSCGKTRKHPENHDIWVLVSWAG